MSNGGTRLSTRELNKLFLQGLGSAVTYVEDDTGKPLIVDIRVESYIAKLRVYLYNCTNPPGGRASDEYKSQIIVPGQMRGERGNFVHDDGRIVLLGAYAFLGDTTDAGVFVFWDAMCHENFSYSANIQVKSEIMVAALSSPVSIGKKSNGETIIACRPQYLFDGVKTRLYTVSL